MADPDYQRAQTMIREAMKAAAKECGFTNEVVEFTVVMAACYSAVATELAPSDFLMKAGGVERAADIFTQTLHGMLVEAMSERLSADQAGGRH